MLVGACQTDGPSLHGCAAVPCLLLLLCRRVYFRAGVLEELEERRRKVLAVRVTKAQAAWRSYVWRR